MNIENLVFIAVLLEMSLFINGFVVFNTKQDKLMQHSSQEKLLHDFGTNDSNPSLIKLLFPPKVFLTIGNRLQQQRYKMSVPLSPDMTVLQSLMAATRAHRDSKVNPATKSHRDSKANPATRAHRTRRDSKVNPVTRAHKDSKVNPVTRAHKDSKVNPFNVQLQWNDVLGCYTITEAIGVENSASFVWQFTIRNWTKKVIYKGQCLPLQNLALGPSYKVAIWYKPSRRSG